MASVSNSCRSYSTTEGVVRNGKSTGGHQRIERHNFRLAP
ncbi:IS1 family transposase [Klebsiella pneumoniae]